MKQDESPSQPSAPMTKHERERAILRAIYDESNFDSVVQQESPDFVLGASGSNRFGVEITELFETESDARLVNHPDYVTDLLAGKAPKHKDDLTVLSVSEVTVHSPEGVLKASGIPGIIRQLPTIQDRANTLAEAIARKDKKLDAYSTGLDHVNLIVMDRTDGSWGDKALNVGDLLLSDLRHQLFVTGFREVFFITRTKTKERFYVPLRMLLLMSELYLFADAVGSFDGRGAVNADQIVALFVGFMKSKGRPIDMVEGRDGHPAAALGNATIQRTSSTVEVIDHTDHPLPPEVSGPSLDSSFVLTPAFADHYSDILSRGVFETELAMDVLIDPSF